VIGSVVWFVVRCILGGYDSFSREHENLQNLGVLPEEEKER
jgi:hypothetical protein